jgi:predicted DNA-binding transcriptional regulator AlpA
MDGYISSKTFLGLLPIKSEKTLRLWAEKRYGPPRVKIGPRKVGYRVADVERFLDTVRAKSAGSLE